ncbi:MAG: hypothetical protein IPP72_20700 [Chitinophagaceae bacterium]|nr:hypothetical protein [Chitinophagaceae bacterium]
MKFFPFKYLTICLLLLFSTAAVQLYANEIEIRYHLPEAKKITLVWGVNDWQYYGQAPVGTIRSGKVMHTPMLREGNDFIVRINIPKENVIDYAFIITKPAGLLRLDAEYWNLNNKSANKFYHLVTDSSQVIKMNDPIDYSSLRSNITLSGYSYSLFFFFTASALLVFFIKKYYFKTPARQFNQTGFFTALSLLLTSGLFFIRIFIADIILPMLLKPVSILPYVFSTAWSDTLFAALLILFFGVLFLLLKKFRKLVLIFYTVIVFIVLITAIINIKVTELIGQPLNYQWLYYSDFLNSTDSSKAIGANVTADFITAGIFLLLAFVVLLWLLYQSYRRWPLAVAMIFPLLLAGSFLVQLKKPAKIRSQSTIFLFYCIP